MNAKPSLPRSSTAPGTQNSFHRPIPVEQSRRNTDGAINEVGETDIPVVARISVHVLREERAYHVCRTLTQTIDPNGNHFVRPLERLRLPGQGDEGPISVCIFEHLGPNYLTKVIDYGHGWFYFDLREGAPIVWPKRNTVLESMSLQNFLDFAIGAAECIEVLHAQQVVHGELRGDAFHMCPRTGRVSMMNFGPGRLRNFEHGLTSSGWSTMSKELGAKTKLSFMSPEQTGRMPLEPDSQTDIFSLGVLFWTLLLQKPAFDGETPLDIIQAVLGQRLSLISDIRLDVPEIIGRIIQKATAKSVWDRYHSASGLRYDLTEVRRLLSIGDASKLPNWEIATKDVSPSFILPQVMVGRTIEHDAIVKAIDYAYKLRQANSGRDKPSTAHLSRLSENHSSVFELNITAGDVIYEDRESSSIGERSPSEGGNGDLATYKANISIARSRQNSSVESLHIATALLSSGLPLADRKPLLSLDSPGFVESLNDDGEGSISSSEGVGGMFSNKGNRWIRSHGRCEVITIAGAAGLGKSRLIQSVQVEARQRGYFASQKFDKSQTERRPFEPILNLLSSLFQQVFAESNVDSPFHQRLKRRVAPVWHMLHKMLGLPKILFDAQLPIRKGSQASRYSSTDRLNRGLSPKGSEPRMKPTKGFGNQNARNFLLAGSPTQSTSLMNIILDILRLFTQHNFICFCLDDLHLADDESLELIAQIISTKIKMVIILAYRKEDILSENLKRVLDPLKLKDEGEYHCSVS